MKKIKLLYIFSKSRNYKNLKKQSSFVFYGYDKFLGEKRFTTKVLKSQRKNNIWLLWRPFEWYLKSKIGVGFGLDQVLINLKLINEQDIVLAANNSAGLPLALLKKIGLIKPKVVFISAGLIDKLETNKSDWVLQFCRWFLKAASLIICWSPLEEDLFKKLLGVKAKFITLEANLDYFQPETKHRFSDFVLAVGRDKERDYDTLFKALADLKIPAKVIAHPACVKNQKVPTRVRLYTRIIPPSVLRDWYKKARLVVLNIKDVKRFSGQRSLLEALAMKKAVVASKTKALTSTYNLKDGKEIIFYKPENLKDLKNKINLVYNDLDKIKKLGKAGRSFVKKIPKNCFYLTLKECLLELFFLGKAN